MAGDKKKNRKDGLYWTPLGGNNVNDITASTHLYTSRHTNEDGIKEKTSILVDFGLYGLVSDRVTKNIDSIVPDARKWFGLDTKDNKKRNINQLSCEIEEKKVKGIFLTHAHIDHLGAIPRYIRLGYKLPEIYASPYTEAMLKQSLAFNKVPKEKWPEIKTINAGEKIKVGNIDVEAVPVSHSVPDSLGFIISTPDAKIFHTGDIKLDQTSSLGQPTDLKRLAELGKENKVDAMILDNANATKEGLPTPEAEVEETFKRLVKENKKGKVVVAMSGHVMNRVASLAKVAAETGRTLVIDGGFYMNFHIRGMQQSGFDLKKVAGDNLKICPAAHESKKFPPERTLIVTTGARGEKISPLYRATTKKGYPNFTIEADDSVIIESSHSKRAEEKIAPLVKALKSRGAKVITTMDEPKIHSSGHLHKEDTKELVSTVNPKYVIPVHCPKTASEKFYEMAKQEGIPVPDMLPENSTTLHISSKHGVNHFAKHNEGWIGTRKEDKATYRGRSSYAELPNDFKDEDLAKAGLRCTFIETLTKIAMKKTMEEKAEQEKKTASEKIKAIKENKKTFRTKKKASKEKAKNVQKQIIVNSKKLSR